MPSMRSLPAVTAAALALILTAPHASADPADFYDALHSMMADLKPHSRRDARTIKEAYRPLVPSRLLVNRADLEAALDADEVALLPDHVEPLNLRLRLDGRSPIGEKDLDNQAKYLGARPAALGLLYAIAARVESGPIEVTSLVRHLQYQRALGATNANARTDVPTHAMGMAVDIALINTPLERAYELRDVLREMRDAGSLYFIGESRQLVFHVVPTPSWLGYYESLHFAKTHAPAPAPLPVVDVEAAWRAPVPPPPALELSWWHRTLIP